MDIVVAISVCVALLIVVVKPGAAAEVPREPLDRLWEDHMLAGTYGLYAEGKRQEYTPEHSYEDARGRPDSAAILTKQGIAIGDHRETRFLGLWRGGGWNLEGGLLGRVEQGNSALELYGKRVTRIQPSFILNVWAWHSPKVEFSYEFFLLHRKKAAAPATILKKWVFLPHEVGLDDDPYPSPDVEGSLKYDPTSKTATVTITGLKRPVEERIDLSKVVHE